LRAHTLGFATDHRGDVVLVAAPQPPSDCGRAVAIARLVACEPDATGGFEWVFEDPRPLDGLEVTPGEGLWDLELPAAAWERANAPMLSDERIEELKDELAGDVGSARRSLERASEGFHELATARPAGIPADFLRTASKTARDLTDRIDGLLHAMAEADPSWAARVRGQAEEARAGSHEASGARAQPSRRLDLLVVDDEAILRRALERMLKLRYTVRTAGTKTEALVALVEREPDVVICDYHLNWENTEDLLRIVAERYPRVRRVLYSSSRIETWCELLDRKLIHTAVSKMAPRSELIAALVA
jgi:CheY-like chemotaxis protein